MRFLLYGVCSFATIGTNGQLGSLAELEKLDTRCAMVWRHDATKSGRIKRDSALVACFCFDKERRRLDMVEWNVRRMRGGYIDSTSTIRHEEFIPDGTTWFKAEGTKRRAVEEGDYFLETRASVLQRDQAGLVVRNEAIVLTEARISFEDYPVVYARDTTDWYIDSMIHSNGVLIKTDRRRSKGFEMDRRFDTTWQTTVDSIPNLCRRTSLWHGRPSASTTTLYANGRAVLRIDSAFVYVPGEGRVDIILGETKWAYRDSMLVAYENVNWRDSYGSNWFSPEPGHRPVLRVAPSRELRTFVYENGRRVKAIDYHERGRGVLDSTVYFYVDGAITRRMDYHYARGRNMVFTTEYENGEPLLADGQHELPELVLGQNGLPLVRCFYQWKDLKCDRYEYTDVWPLLLPDGSQFDWLKAYVPR